MKKIVLFLGILSSIFSAPLRAYSNFHPIDGFYWGFIAGAQYLDNFSNVQLPAMPDVVNTLTNPFAATYRNSIGFGGDISFGYRIFERIRGEAEIFYGYQKINSIQANDGTPVSPRNPTQYPGSGNKLLGDIQNYGAMVNGFVDLYWDRPNSESTFTPYVGGGVGYARMQVGTVIDYSFADPNNPSNGLELRNLSHDARNQFVWQGIAGFGWFPDDFTFAGVDFRYQDFGVLDTLNGKARTYGAYLFFNFSFG